jgi:FMN phosphatase YigB (HAD superfamily)
MKKLLIIFDLDGTLIDSTHRMLDWNFHSKEECIKYWTTHNIPENCHKDKLLPLVEVYRELRKTQHTIVALTARTLQFWDYEYFKNNDLVFDAILHREDSLELDHIMKENHIQKLLKQNYVPYLAFDDLEANLKVMQKYGFITINAKHMNENLRKF